MLKYKLFTIYIFLQTAFCGCQQDKHRADFETVGKTYEVTQLGKMDKAEVAESSGFAWADGGMGYSLVGQAAADTLKPIANEVRRQARTI